MKRHAMIIAVLLLALAIGSFTETVGAAVPTKRSPSKACLRALDAAERVAGVAHETLTGIATFFTGIGESANANANDVGQFLTDMNDLLTPMNATVETQSATLTPLVAKYNTNSAKCRLGR